MEKIKDTIFITISAIFFILLGSIVAGNYLEKKQSSQDEFYKKQIQKFLYKNKSILV